LSAQENIETVKALYEAFGRGDVATILDSLTDDVDWAVEAAADAAPWYGQRTGKDAVASFFEDLAGAVSVLEFTPQSYAANDSEVMVLIRFRASSNSTGREAAMNVHHYWRFRDGTVDHWRGSEDTAQTAAMLHG
jgi:ketosteroid isomerase-like protein